MFFFQSEYNSPTPRGDQVLRTVLQSAIADLRKKKEKMEKEKKKLSQDLGDVTNTDSVEEQPRKYS